MLWLSTRSNAGRVCVCVCVFLCLCMCAYETRVDVLAQYTVRVSMLLLTNCV